MSGINIVLCHQPMGSITKWSDYDLVDAVRIDFLKLDDKLSIIVNSLLR